MADTELLPCPFCGGTDAFVERADYSSAFVVCDSRVDEHSVCMARGPIAVQDDDGEEIPGGAGAIAAWNRRAALASRPAEVDDWINVEDRLPGKERCLAAYVNAMGKHRIIRAIYAGQFQIDAGEDAIDQGNCEYNEADDTFYLKAGWLECIDNWDDYSSIYVTEGTVTHWRSLPSAPSHTTNKDGA